MKNTLDRLALIRRSPGCNAPMEESRGDDWKLSCHGPGFQAESRGFSIGEYLEIELPEIASEQLSAALQDFSSLESLPRTAS
jgi:hypothetical protein